MVSSSLIWLLFYYAFHFYYAFTVLLCFTAIFENITHALYKRKRPCKAWRNVYMGKKRPTKARSRFYESGIPVRWENLFSIITPCFKWADFDFSIELFYKARSRSARRPLCRDVFSPYKHPLNVSVTWLKFLIKSNL